MADAKGYVRAYVFAGTIDEAQERARPLVALLSQSAQVRNLRLQRYWKIPEYWEVVCDLDAFDLAALSMLLAADWSVAKEHEAIWDHRLSGPFAVAGVAWAHLERLD